MSLAGVVSSARVHDWKQKVLPFALLFGIFIAFHFSALAQFTLSIDDETGAFNTTALNWANQGRWVLFVLETWVFDQPTLAYFPLAFFGLCASASYLLVCDSFEIDVSDPRAYVLFVFFSAFPTYFFIGNFLSNILGMGVGLAAGCWAMVVFSKWQRLGDESAQGLLPTVRCWSIVALCTAVAVGTYQSLILAIVTGCMALVAHRALVRGQWDGWVRFFACHAGIASALIGGAILSEAISSIIRESYGSGGALASTYYSRRYLQVDGLLGSPGRVLGETLRQMAMVYGGAPSVYGFTYRTIPLLLAIGFLSGILRASRIGILHGVAIACYLAAILCAPFLINLVTGGQVPFRVLIGVPMAFWFFAWLGSHAEQRAIRAISVSLSIIVALQCLYTFSAFQTTRRLTLQHDTLLAAQIYDRIAVTVPAFDRNRVYPIDFFGAYEFKTIYPQVESSTLGGSFFQWDSGHPSRIINFMKLVGFSNFAEVSQHTREQTTLQLASMPVWPQKGSVVYENGAILVRLGTRPDPFHERFLLTAARQATPVSSWTMDSEVTDYRVANTQVTRKPGGTLALSEGDDVQFMFSTGASIFKDCRVLRVDAEIFAARPDRAQFFYYDDNRRINTVNFGWSAVGPGHHVEFLLSSEVGFSDYFRLDPVETRQATEILGLSLSCIRRATL